LRAGRSPRELSEGLGVCEQTLRNWRRQEQIDRRERDDGVTSDERAELARLRRENQRLRQERDLLSEPRPSSRRRARPGDLLSDRPGGEGLHPGLRGLRAAWRLNSEVFEFVEGFYNTTSRHSTLGYLSPAQFETMTTININNENG
jgi:transposase